MVYKVDVIVLGAYTSPLTHDGEDIKTMVKALAMVLGRFFPRLQNVIVSHGDSLSAAFAIQQLEEVRKKYGMKRCENPLAVVGATGIIGNALARWYANKRQRLLVIGRTPSKLRDLLEALRAQGFEKVEGAIWANGRDPEGFPRAQDLLPRVKFGAAFTSHPGELITEAHLNPAGSVWGDGAQPNNLGRDIYSRAPIVAVDLSIAWSEFYPEKFGGFDMGNPPNCLYACGSEGLVIAYTLATKPELASKLRHMQFVGEIQLEAIEVLTNLAAEAGIIPARPSWFGHFIDLPEEIPERVFRLLGELTEEVPAKPVLV
jgi:predicted amino acid dehydrogenase